MTQIGPFDVSGPPKRLNWVRSTLASLDPDVDPMLLLPRTVPLEFGRVKKVPGFTYYAAGYTLNGPKLLVRHGMTEKGAGDLSKETTEYVIAHEGFGHGRLAIRPISAAGWARLVGLLKGTSDGTYWSRRSEVIIDAAIEAISGIESPYKHDPAKPKAGNRYRLWIDEADYPIVKATWLEGLAAPPPPPPPIEPPPPDPLPPPPDVAAENAALRTRLAEVAELAVKPVGIGGGSG